MVTCPPAAAPSGFNGELADVACISRRWAVMGYGENQLMLTPPPKKKVLSYEVQEKPATDSLLNSYYLPIVKIT